MMGTAWRLSSFYELLTGRRAPISKESVENTNKDHQYATQKLERTLQEKGLAWTYASVQSTIEATVPAVLRTLGPVKR